MSITAIRSDTLAVSEAKMKLAFRFVVYN